MTVTLELSPDAEAGLRSRAARRGQSLTDYLLTLAEWEDYADLSVSDEEAGVIEQGLAELAGGDKGISQEEFDSQMTSVLARLRHRKSGLTA